MAMTRELCLDKNIENHISFTTNGTFVDQEIVCLLAKYAPINFQITIDAIEASLIKQDLRNLGLELMIQ